MFILFAERGRFELSSIATTFSTHHGYILDCAVNEILLVGQDVSLINYIKYSLVCDVNATSVVSIDVAFSHTNSISLTCAHKNLLLKFVPFTSSLSINRELSVGSFSLNGVAINQNITSNIICDKINLSTALSLDVSKSMNLDCGQGSFAILNKSFATNKNKSLNISSGSFIASSQTLFTALSRSTSLSNGTFVLSGYPLQINKTLSSTLDSSSFVLNFVDITHGRDFIFDIESKRIISRISIGKFFKNNLPTIDPCL